MISHVGRKASLKWIIGKVRTRRERQLQGKYSPGPEERETVLSLDTVSISVFNSTICDDTPSRRVQEDPNTHECPRARCESCPRSLLVTPSQAGIFSCKKLVKKSNCSGTTTLLITGPLSRICTTKTTYNLPTFYIFVFREDIINPQNEAKTDNTRLHGCLRFYARLIHACNIESSCGAHSHFIIISVIVRQSIVCWLVNPSLYSPIITPPSHRRCILKQSCLLS